MLEYGILQSQQVKLSEIMGDLPIYDLNLYEELGNIAHKAGDKKEAMKWYLKGLSMARVLNHSDKIELFSDLILNNI